MAQKGRRIVAEQASSGSFTAFRMTAGTCHGKFNRNCYAVRGSETADAILWLFGLSGATLERTKEWLCDSGKSLLGF
jgi:hypothetical protein